MVSSRLTVGLSVGIPAALILGAVCLVWWWNQRKQNKEDLLHNEIDLDLRDDRSFTNMQDELLKTYGDPTTISTTHKLEDSTTSTENTNTATSKGSGSGYVGSSHSSTSVSDQQQQQQQQLQQPQHPNQAHPHQQPQQLTNPSTPRQSSRYQQQSYNQNQRTPSSFDFYESVIPILPQSASKGTLDDPSNANTNPLNTASNSNVHSRNPSGDFLSQPPALHDKLSTSKSSSSSSIANLTNTSKSLDNLAKQLTQPALFEKLPSRSTAARISQSQQQQQQQQRQASNNQYRNSTLGTYSIGGQSSTSSQDRNTTSTSEVPSSEPQLSKVLGGNFDNSFNPKQPSPFQDEEEGASENEGVSNGVVFK